jgi:hypothetical protein
MKRINFRSKKTIILAVVIAVVVIGGGFALYKVRQSSQEPPTSAGAPPNTVNLNPPTEEEQATGNQQKDAVLESEKARNENNPSNGQKRQVTPVITSASESGVSAYVPGVFEEGGTCTLTLKQGSQTVTRNSEGFANVQNTGCAPFTLNRGDFPSAGSWTATVSYNSSTAQGSSSGKEFKVQ